MLSWPNTCTNSIVFRHRLVYQPLTLSSTEQVVWVAMETL